MEPRPNPAPLIVLVGETASGKTALGIELARQFNGEIIAADSRTVYTGMDIGTAKPTPEEMQGIPHHLLDVVTPDRAFTAADFKRQAEAAIAAISARGRLPIMVGGSGLYIDSVIYDFQFRGGPDLDLRQELQSLGVDELQGRLFAEGIPLPENSRNPRHLLRSLETKGAIAVRAPLRQNTLVMGLSIDRDALKAKLARRVDLMVEQGFVEEVQRIVGRYGWDAPGLQAPGYRAFRKYLAKEVTLEEAKALFVQNDSQLAKRQRTWFRRNKDIHWLCKKEEAVDLVTTFLNKVYTDT